MSSIGCGLPSIFIWRPKDAQVAMSIGDKLNVKMYNAAYRSLAQVSLGWVAQPVDETLMSATWKWQRGWRLIR